MYCKSARTVSSRALLAPDPPFSEPRTARTPRLRSGLLACCVSSVLLGIGVATARVSDPPAPPATHPGKLMQGLIASINSQSPRRIRMFVATTFDKHSSVNDSWPSRCCNPTEVAATLINLARRSDGLTIGAVQSSGTDVVAFAKTRNGGTPIYLELQASKEHPEKIRSYQIVPMLHPTSEVLDQLSPDASMRARIEEAKRALRRSAEKDLFSGTFAVASHGRILLAAAYGEADKATHRKITLATRFDIASVGKLFTAVAVAQLVAKHVLDYDAPIIRYLPDYPNREVASKITLRQLLTHTSGLADIYAGNKPAKPPRRLRDYYPLFANKPLLFEPGKGRSYSNTGFLVASMVVQRVSGEDFRDYLRTHIFGPAGMTHTGWLKSADTAVPYMLGRPEDPLAPDRSWVSAEPFYAALLSGPAAGAGGEYSTVMDLVAFANALQSGRLLDHPALLRLVREGLGCLCSSQAGHLVFEHTGGGPGVDTGLQLDLDRDFVLVFLSDYSPPFPQQLATDLGKLLVD